ncbi:cupin domain-containing protein [Planctomycetota bacterium]
MIICHENNAVEMKVAEPFKRTLKVLLSPILNSEVTSIAAGLTILPAGGKSDDHKHHEGEMFYVVSGCGRIRVGGEVEELVPGTIVWGQPGIVHQLINNSSEILKVLWVLSPPGREAAIIKNKD